MSVGKTTWWNWSRASNPCTACSAASPTSALNPANPGSVRWASSDTFYNNPRTRAAAAARWLGVGPAVLSRHVAELGYLRDGGRHPDPDDARAQLLELTDAGRAAVSGQTGSAACSCRRCWSAGTNPRPTTRSRRWARSRPSSAPASNAGSVAPAPKEGPRNDGSQGNPGPETCGGLRAGEPHVMKQLIGVLASFFAAMLSATIVSIALPTIMADLHGSQPTSPGSSPPPCWPTRPPPRSGASWLTCSRRSG